MPHTGETFSELPTLERWEYDILGDPIRDEAITVSTTVVGLNPPDLAKGALVETQVQPIRWRVSGNDPSAAVGHRQAANERLQLGGIRTLRAFRAIREGAADATLFVSYFD